MCTKLSGKFTIIVYNVKTTLHQAASPHIPQVTAQTKKQLIDKPLDVTRVSPKHDILHILALFLQKNLVDTNSVKSKPFSHCMCHP